MSALSHDLAWTLIHFLWQGLLIALVGNILLGTMRRSPAATRYLTAYLTLLTMVAAMAATFITLRANRTLAPDLLAAEAVTPVVAGSSGAGSDSNLPASAPAITVVAPELADEAAPSSRQARPNWKRIVLLLWAGGVALLTVWRLVGLVGISRLRRRSRTAPVTLKGEFLKLRGAIGASRRAVVRVSELAAVPVVIGALRPVVLVPASALTGLSPDQLRAVLAHELAHIRRHDYIANLLQAAVETLLFFHPCVWWLSATIRREREHACDDIAVETCGDRLTYAKALGTLAEIVPSPIPPFAIAAVGRTGDLLARVSRVLRPGPAAGGSGFGSASLLIAIGIAAAVAAPPADKPVEEPKANSAEATGRGRILDRKGRILAETVEGQRLYPFGALASHTLGYVGRKRRGSDEVEGRYGVEMSGENQLQTGDLKLTLDLQKQFAVESVLRETGIGMGTVVVLDPNTGDVVAMASAASFDPNHFVPVITREKFSELADNPALPLFNRAVAAQYPPGSTMKTISSLAIGDVRRHFECDGTVELGSAKLKCWNRHGHGDIDLVGALTQSCNCYYYHLGIDAGLEKIHTIATEGFGLGQTTGIELQSDQDGAIPSSAYLKERGLEEKVTSAPLLAIGQGYTQATPLQMAVVAATFANGGKRPAPRLFLDREPTPPTPLAGVDPALLATVREAMRKVVVSPVGTARRAMSDSIAIAGKTGTAQWKPNDRHVGWFIGFAPFNEPRYAIAVVVENAKAGGAVCAPVAKKILERLAAIDAGEEVVMKPIAPIEGHDKLIELVE